jgi:hypothetical protein
MNADYHGEDRVDQSETIAVQLTGRQCRVISWLFTDFLEAAVLLPEMPLDLIYACRSIVTFTRGIAETTHNGADGKVVSMSATQGHFIAFALTLEAMRRIPDRPDLLAVIGNVGAAFTKIEPRRLGVGKEDPPTTVSSSASD